MNQTLRQFAIVNLSLILSKLSVAEEKASAPTTELSGSVEQPAQQTEPPKKSNPIGFCR
jgi:hypothetical protein